MARSSNILEEYLVGLGFNLDTVGYARFAGMLRDAEHLTDLTYAGMTKAVLQFEASAVAAFATLGAGILTFAEKTAMADQEYRLLALRMYTSLPVARELKIALDALGQPLENVIWDPELAARFGQLVRDQQAMTKELGPDFENQMLKIRDVRFEFTRLGVELKYLSMLVVEDLAKAFGMTMGELLGKMKEFNAYIIQHMPEIANWIATTLKPVLLDVKDIMAELWDLVKVVTASFTNFIGIVTGNKALEGQEADMRKFAEAVKITVERMAHLVGGILKVGTNIALLFHAGEQAATGNFKGAVSDIYKMKPFGLADFGLVDAAPRTAPAAEKSIHDQIAEQAAAHGVPADLALAVAQVESGMRQFDSSGNLVRSNKPGSHAMGIFQLQPGTAADMGVDPKDTTGNIIGGISYLKKMLDLSKGNVESALEHYYGSADPAANRAYAEKVMRVDASLTVQNLNVTIQGHGDPATVKSAVQSGISEADRQRVQRVIAEFNSPAWGY